MTRHIIKIEGVVQGVGFRPFVSMLAKQLNIYGFVKNIGSSVYIDAQGTKNAIEQFEKLLQSDAPKISAINSIVITEQELTEYKSFEVQASEVSNEIVQIPSDMGICEHCEHELFDITSRRYLYPFTVCSHCGPRYTLIEDVPYDRATTSMKKFKMCEKCEKEYYDITQRRYRCEPICCPDCGPSLVLADNNGNVIKNKNDDVIKLTRQYLLEGKIIAIKGIGGFHLACNAYDEKAVQTLRNRKKRDGKPFALMANDCESIEKHCKLNNVERQLISSPQKPIVILEKKNMESIAGDVAKGIGNLGVMLAYTPLHKLIFNYPDELEFPKMLVMTSGNVSGEPICIDNDEAIQKLNGIADYFVLHDRDILLRADDSIVREFDGQPIMIRRARGYVPQPVTVPCECQVFASGSDMKSTFCLTRVRYAYLSPYIGDLEDFETFKLYKDTFESYSKKLGITANNAVFDLHPSYYSSQFAKGLDMKKMGIQHHYAHILSCMAENGINSKIIGVAFDGTGYGTDGTVWGGELFLCDISGFERIGHLKPITMFGGDSASAEPWKSAVSHIFDAFGDDVAYVWQTLFLTGSTQAKTGLLALKGQVNCHVTSSCGRLFDAISAMCGIRTVNEYEGQSATELEYIANKECNDEYDIEISHNIPYILNTENIIKSVFNDIVCGVSVDIISAKFHNTLAKYVLCCCEITREKSGIKKVCLGGGVFQNMLLMGKVVSSLRNKGFEVYWNKNIPMNDGGIALGQVIYQCNG